MKKTILLTLTITILFTIFSFGQSAKTISMLKQIEGQYNIDDNGNITYTQVIQADSLSKDEIYNRALNYFVYNYNDGKSVIQTQDRKLGRIICKGLYKDAHVSISLATDYISCWHIVRIDVKNGKARIILTLTEYEEKIFYGKEPPAYKTSEVKNNYPINPKGKYKTSMGKAFYKTHKKAIETLDKIENAIKNGNTSKSIEDSNW